MKIRHILVVFVALGLLAVAGAAFGKAHVPADEVQVSHKGRKAINVDAPALKAHLRHGDVQLPACDFANVFVEGDDTSDVVATFPPDGGVLYADGALVDRESAEGITPACPPGTY